MIDSKLLLLLVMDEFNGLRLDDFDERLTLQKRVYLLKQFGLDLGYHHNWYVRGPYSPGLTQDAFECQSKLAEYRTSARAFSLTDASRENISRFKDFEGNLRTGPLPLSLELSASIHYLIHVGFLPGGPNRDNIAAGLRDRGKEFTNELFDEVWDALEAAGLIGQQVTA